MKKYAMLAMVFAITNAFASNNETNPCGNSGNNCGSVNPVTVPVSIGSTNVNTSNNLNQNFNNSNSFSQGVGYGGNGYGGSSSSSSGAVSGADARATANNSGNTQSVTFSSPADQTIRTVGEAPSVIGSATAPCRVAVGASAGWLGGAFGIGTSVMDESCNLREVSRHLYNIGLRAEAVKVMCQDETAKAVMGAICKE